MAVHIKLIKNNIKNSSSYGKYFAKSVSQGEVTLDEIAAEACRNSHLSEGAVIGVDNPKDFNIRHHITRIVCGFLPAGRRIQGRHILYDFCDGVKAVWQKGFKP